MQEIRELRISDYDSLMDLILGIYVEYPSALHFSSRPTEAEISALLVAKIAAIETGNGVDLVMTDGDRIIGECEVFKSDGCAFLGIIVGKGVRRMGVGTRLVREKYHYKSKDAIGNHAEDYPKYRLACLGYKVIAIDNADLDTDAFAKEGIEVLKAECGGAEENIRSFSVGSAGVLHIRCSFEEASGAVLKSGIRSDFIGIDVNAGPDISASALLMYLPTLKDGCKSVMTIKCKTKNVWFNIEAAQRALGNECRMVRIKALPSNRQEITALCVKN